jgi:hypothetical protein
MIMRWSHHILRSDRARWLQYSARDWRWIALVAATVPDVARSRAVPRLA